MKKKGRRILGRGRKTLIPAQGTSLGVSGHGEANGIWTREPHLDCDASGRRWEKDASSPEPSQAKRLMKKGDGMNAIIGFQKFVASPSQMPYCSNNS
jgi:hypothetical protein